MLVLEPFRLCDPTGSPLHGLPVGVSSVRDLQRDVLRRVNRSERSTRAKTEATKGCRFATSVARDAPILCNERNQSASVTTSGPAVATASSTHTFQPTP